MEGAQFGTPGDALRAASSGAAVGAVVFIPLHLMLDSSTPMSLLIAFVAALVTWRMVAAVRHRALLRSEVAKGAFASAVIIVGAMVISLPPGELGRMVNPASAVDRAAGICPETSAVLDDLVAAAEADNPAATGHVQEISVDASRVVLAAYDESASLLSTYTLACDERTVQRQTTALDPASAETFDLALVTAGDLNQLFDAALAHGDLAVTASDSLSIRHDVATGEPAIRIVVGTGTDQVETIETGPDGQPR